MSDNIHLGISTCPNDTFAFHGLMNRLVDWRGLNFHVDLLDIQQLNQRLFAGDFDVAKASFHAALLLAEDTIVLPSGSALGRGVGPLLLAAKPHARPTVDSQVVLCPGEHTTATLLFKLFYPGTARIEHVVFSEIMPMLQAGKADFGVCIHEGRFTWQQEGLHCVADLGELWEKGTDLPLPLGGIVARNNLPISLLSNVQAVIYDSLQLALADADSALPTMRKYAQEFSDDVLMQHVELYVNDWTTDLGVVGRSALNELSQRAKSIALLSEHANGLQVLDQ